MERSLKVWGSEDVDHAETLRFGLLHRQGGLQVGTQRKARNQAQKCTSPCSSSSCAVLGNDHLVPKTGDLVLSLSFILQRHAPPDVAENLPELLADRLVHGAAPPAEHLREFSQLGALDKPSRQSIQAAELCCVPCSRELTCLCVPIHVLPRIAKVLRMPPGGQERQQSLASFCRLQSSKFVVLGQSLCEQKALIIQAEDLGPMLRRLRPIVFKTGKRTSKRTILIQAHKLARDCPVKMSVNCRVKLCNTFVTHP